jgi:hypothetical protein
MRWVGAYDIYGVWWGNLGESHYLEHLSIYERVILKWVIKYWAGRVLSGFIWFTAGNSGRLLQT